MSTWRIAGLNYVNYSTIAAKVLRKSLKPDLREAGARRDETLIKLHFWAGGKSLPNGEKPRGDKEKT